MESLWASVPPFMNVFEDVITDFHTSDFPSPPHLDPESFMLELSLLCAWQQARQIGES